MEIARVGEGAGIGDPLQSLFHSGQCRTGCHQRPSLRAPLCAIVGREGPQRPVPRSCKRIFLCLSFWGSNCWLSSQAEEDPEAGPVRMDSPLDSSPKPQSLTDLSLSSLASCGAQQGLGSTHLLPQSRCPVGMGASLIRTLKFP